MFAGEGQIISSIYLPSTTLLNFGDVELEEAVEPCNEFLSVVWDAWSAAFWDKALFCAVGRRLKICEVISTYRDSPMFAQVL
jgi:hypothetical protein